MYIYIHIYIHTHTYIYLYVFVYIYIYIYVYVCMYIYTPTHIDVYICIHTICIYIYTHIYIHACIHKCLFTHAYILIFQECELRPLNQADGSARFNFSRSSVLAGVHGLFFMSLLISLLIHDRFLFMSLFIRLVCFVTRLVSFDLSLL